MSFQYQHLILKALAEGLISSVKEIVYLEMGIGSGNTFNYIAPLCKKAYAVDINCGSFQSISSNTNLQWLCETTNSFIKKLDNKEIEQTFNLVFIDADHSHSKSLEDFIGISKYVCNNGLICLHDTYPPDESYSNSGACFDSYKTAWYIRQNMRDDFEIVTLPFYFGVSIVRKTSKQVPWL